jgi:hypothetical protein
VATDHTWSLVHYEFDNIWRIDFDRAQLADKNGCSITYAGQDIQLFHLCPHEKPEMEIKMAKFSDKDSFIGFLDLENMGVETKIVSLSRSQAETSLFEGFQLSPLYF